MENRVTRLLYDYSPVFLQDLYCSMYGWLKIRRRYGRLFEERYRLFERSAGWTRGELDAYQDDRLRAVVQHAYEHVEFYRRRFDAARLTPADIRTVADLPKLPLLEKEEIRQAGSTMIADTCDRRSLFAHPTSGSTGLPMTLYTDRDALQTEYAFTWARRRPGVTRGEPYSSFTGLQIVRPGQKSGPFWRKNYAANQTMYSVFHMNDRTLPKYVADLDRHPLAYMEGYPAPVYTIAEFIERTGAEFSNYPRAVFSTSEELQPNYRRTIERVMRTKVWDMYGQGEFAAAVTEYPCGHMHYDMDYGIIELLEVGREDGLVKAEMICTSLYNRSWPLIRYRVGDLVLLDPGESPAPQCGHQGPIIRRIHGRTGAYFILPDGTKVTNISVIAKRCRNIVSMQVLQEQAGQIEILVQKAPGFGPEDEQTILDSFAAKLGGDLRMSIRYVDGPVLSRRGKFMSIISRRG